MKDMLDGPGFEIYNPYKSKCAKCLYLENMYFTCPAFPEGIPVPYLSGDKVHDKVDPEQVGQTVFTSKT